MINVGKQALIKALEERMAHWDTVCEWYAKSQFKVSDWERHLAAWDAAFERRERARKTLIRHIYGMPHWRFMELGRAAWVLEFGELTLPQNGEITSPQAAC